MILTNAQKDFLIKNKQVLIKLFEGRIEDLKEEIINEINPTAREAKVGVVQDYRIWIKDITELAAPKETQHENLI